MKNSLSALKNQLVNRLAGSIEYRLIWLVLLVAILTTGLVLGFVYMGQFPSTQPAFNLYADTKYQLFAQFDYRLVLIFSCLLSFLVSTVFMLILFGSWGAFNILFHALTIAMILAVWNFFQIDYSLYNLTLLFLAQAFFHYFQLQTMWKSAAFARGRNFWYTIKQNQALFINNANLLVVLFLISFSYFLINDPQFNLQFLQSLNLMVVEHWFSNLAKSLVLLFGLFFGLYFLLYQTLIYCFVHYFATSYLVNGGVTDPTNYQSTNLENLLNRVSRKSSNRWQRTSLVLALVFLVVGVPVLITQPLISQVTDANLWTSFLTTISTLWIIMLLFVLIRYNWFYALVFVVASLLKLALYYLVISVMVISSQELTGFGLEPRLLFIYLLVFFYQIGTQIQQYNQQSLIKKQVAFINLSSRHSWPIHLVVFTGVIINLAVLFGQWPMLFGWSAVLVIVNWGFDRYVEQPYLRFFTNYYNRHITQRWQRFFQTVKQDPKHEKEVFGINE